MSKAELNALENMLRMLNASIKFLNREDIFICSNALPTNLSYYNSEGKGLSPMTKFSGNDLAGLLDIKQGLTSMLAEEHAKKAIKKIKK
jgi:hypothetical protein